MKETNGMGKPSWWIAVFLLMLLGVGCTKTAENCPVPSPVDLTGMQAYFEDENAPVQFPLDNQMIFESRTPFSTEFAKNGRTTRGPEHHAAEDILQPAGTPVYAMADGVVSFSGRMGGYGWLVIIDHSQVNIYSLYGHLSPSRWQIEKGPVKKGELIGYLGDPDENGGSVKNPLRPHLHFGVRAGQRDDYPGMGQWRWQAGWIKPCPQDLGWLQPSIVITSQFIQIGDINEPTAGFLNKWGTDILFSGVYIFGGLFMYLFAEKQRKPILIITAGIMFIVVAWILVGREMIASYVLFVMATLFIMIGIYRLMRGTRRNSQEVLH